MEFEYEDNGDGTIAITGVKEINSEETETNGYCLINFPETIDGKTVIIILIKPVLLNKLL